MPSGRVRSAYLVTVTSSFLLIDMTVTTNCKRNHSGSNATSGTRNVPKEVSQRKLSELFRVIEQGFRDFAPSDSQQHSSSLIRQALMHDKHNDENALFANVMIVMDRNVFLSRIYEAWQDVKATNQTIRKEVCDE